jgi:cytoskeletal protein RodZ
MTVQRFPVLLGMLSLTVSGLLIAQTSPTPSSPASQTQPSQPDSQAPTDSPSAPHSSTDPSTNGNDTHAALKRCIAQLRAQNPSASDQAIIEACQSQIGGGSPPKQ